eukprot:TRINITY_DN6189_c0_g1_i2.p1 TRINITY_DN6189_c0_g1~~TRINITY_DN6189_c0_g1_i2.p1  ORF type:complete len:228 (-),score=57.34 TRINITY_DN6189_c0_g1_i2:60-743(-)
MLEKIEGLSILLNSQIDKTKRYKEKYRALKNGDKENPITGLFNLAQAKLSKISNSRKSKKIVVHGKRKRDESEYLDTPRKRAKKEYNNYYYPKEHLDSLDIPATDSPIASPVTPRVKALRDLNKPELASPIKISKSSSMKWGKESVNAEDYYWDDTGESTQVSSKFLEPWATKEQLGIALEEQKEIDPDTIFKNDSGTCTIQLPLVFGFNKKYTAIRGDSNDWSHMK